MHEIRSACALCHIYGPRCTTDTHEIAERILRVRACGQPLHWTGQCYLRMWEQGFERMDGRSIGIAQISDEGM
jgi:hypothetical protein